MNIGTTITTGANLIAAAMTAVAAGFAWWAARGSKEAGEILSRIERQRRHTELTPQLELSLDDENGPEQPVLVLCLVGPPGLDHLDQLIVSIRDDKVRDGSQLTGGPTAEQVARQIWGPYRFRTGLLGIEQDGRTAELPQQYLPLIKQSAQRFQLDPTAQPQWDESPASEWTDRYLDHPLRLIVRCERDGHEPWEVPLDVSRADAVRPVP
jgi:hypothetical protein